MTRSAALWFRVHSGWGPSVAVRSQDEKLPALSEALALAASEPSLPE